jgi:hypothetical protein
MEIHLNDNDVKEIKNEEKKSCGKCNQKISKTQKRLIFLSLYLIASSLYGTYKFLELLIGLI